VLPHPGRCHPGPEEESYLAEEADAQDRDGEPGRIEEGKQGADRKSDLSPAGRERHEGTQSEEEATHRPVDVLPRRPCDREGREGPEQHCSPHEHRKVRGLHVGRGGVDERGGFASRPEEREFHVRQHDTDESRPGRSVG